MISYGRDYPEVDFTYSAEANFDGTSLYADIGALLAGDLPEAPQPTVLCRDDSVGIFYAGQVNVIFGEPETGKTWIALAALAEHLGAGGAGLIVDLDHNGAAAMVLRLLAFGVSREVLVDQRRFRFTEPEHDQQLDAIVAETRRWLPGVVIVDSIGELMPLLGLGSNSPDEFTTAHGRVLKPLAVAGAATLAIDHLPKNPNSKRQGPTGTAAKRRPVGGASVRVELVEPFVPGRGGVARLRVHKDRHGGLRRHCASKGAEEQVIGTFVLIDTDGALTWTITATGPTSTVVTGVDATADVPALDALDPPPESQRDVKERMGWGSDRSAAALKAWRKQGADVCEDPAADAAPCSATPVSRSEPIPATGTRQRPTVPMKRQLPRSL